MSTITSANATLTIAIASLYPVAQVIQGFSADDVTDVESLDVAETMMGVDGNLSAGFKNVPWTQSIILAASSPSNALFDNWWNAQRTIQDIYYATGLIIYPGTGMKYPLTKGVLKGYKPIPAAKVTLQPRAYSIVWQVGVPTPV